MKTKICIGICGLEKPISEFHKNKNETYGVHYYCKECVKAYYQENKEKFSNRNRKFHKKYPWVKILKSIKDRCENPKNSHYKWYGEKNIKNYLSKKDLKYLWFRDKAYLMDKPSIDRKNSKKDYTLENCQFIEHKENSVKDKRKPILQYDLNRTFIKEFISISEASRILKLQTTNISKVCNERYGYKTCGGYIWKYKNE